MFTNGIKIGYSINIYFRYIEKKRMIIMKSNLKILMATKGVTYDQLSESLKIDRKFLIRLANAKVKYLNLESIKKLSAFFNDCPIQEFLYLEDVA